MLFSQDTWHYQYDIRVTSITVYLSFNEMICYIYLNHYSIRPQLIGDEMFDFFLNEYCGCGLGAWYIDWVCVTSLAFIVFYVSIWEQDIGNECMHPLCYCWFLTSKIFYKHFFSDGHANKCWMCSASVGDLQVTSSSLLRRFIFQWKLHIYASIREFKALSCNSMLCNQWPLHTSMLKIQGSL
jgi:hypothetical protein